MDRWVNSACALLLALLLCAPAAAAEQQDAGWFTLAEIALVQPWEQAVLPFSRSYYSGETVYKGGSAAELAGSCAIHAASVVLSNSRGEPVSAQQIARINNATVRNEADWSNYVAWGRIGKPFQLDFSGMNLADERKQLRAQGLSGEALRRGLMQRVAALFDEHGSSTGLILHFNNSGELNGAGTRHVVVMLGYITEDGEVCDLLLSDSSVPAPEGACVRLSQSSVPRAMLGERSFTQLAGDGEDMALLPMDMLVSCRWLIPAKWPTVIP